MKCRPRSAVPGRLLRMLAWMAVCWVCAPPTASAQRVQLQWRLAAGEQLGLTLQQQTETETTVLGKKRPAKVDIDMTLEVDWDVLRRDGDNAVIRQTVRALKLTMQAADAEVTYDSRSQDAPNTPAARELQEKLAPLVGAEFTLSLSPQGEVLDLQAAQAAGQAPGGGQQPQAEPLLSSDSLQQVLQSSLLTLPDKPLRRGGSWSRRWTAAAALGELTVQRTYTLQGADNSSGRPLQKISLSGRLALRGAEGEEAPHVRLRSQRLTGQFLFDNAAGRLARSRVEQTTVTESLQGDTRVSVRSRSVLSGRLDVR